MSEKDQRHAQSGDDGSNDQNTPPPPPPERPLTQEYVEKGRDGSDHTRKDKAQSDE